MSTKWLTRLENLLTLLFVLACLGALGLLLSTGLIAFSGTASGVGVPPCGSSTYRSPAWRPRMPRSSARAPT
ncbi:hypothetical protein ACFSTC_03970 [Nonomuraea ferruginea]